jgi:hypothetical protein
MGGYFPGVLKGSSRRKENVRQLNLMVLDADF